MSPAPQREEVHSLFVHRRYPMLLSVILGLELSFFLEAWYGIPHPGQSNVAGWTAVEIHFENCEEGLNGP